MTTSACGERSKKYKINDEFKYLFNIGRAMYLQTIALSDLVGRYFNVFLDLINSFPNVQHTCLLQQNATHRTYPSENTQMISQFITISNRVRLCYRREIGT